MEFILYLKQGVPLSVSRHFTKIIELIKGRWGGGVGYDGNEKVQCDDYKYPF